MSETSLDNTPPDISEAAKDISNNLLLEKSRKLYEKTYQDFINWKLAKHKMARPPVKFYVRMESRWCEVDANTGTIESKRHKARFVYARNGRLHMARRSLVLRGLRHLAAGRPTTVRDGPRLSPHRMSEMPGRERERERHREAVEPCRHCCDRNHGHDCLRNANDNVESRNVQTHTGLSLVAKMDASTQVDACRGQTNTQPAFTLTLGKHKPEPKSKRKIPLSAESPSKRHCTERTVRVQDESESSESSVRRTPVKQPPRRDVFQTDKVAKIELTPLKNVKMISEESKKKLSAFRKLRLKRKEKNPAVDRERTERSVNAEETPKESTREVDAPATMPVDQNKSKQKMTDSAISEKTPDWNAEEDSSESSDGDDPYRSRVNIAEAKALLNYSEVLSKDNKTKLRYGKTLDKNANEHPADDAPSTSSGKRPLDRIKDGNSKNSSLANEVKLLLEDTKSSYRTGSRTRSRRGKAVDRSTAEDSSDDSAFTSAGDKTYNKRTDKDTLQTRLVTESKKLNSIKNVSGDGRLNTRRKKPLNKNDSDDSSHDSESIASRDISPIKKIANDKKSSGRTVKEAEKRIPDNNTITELRLENIQETRLRRRGHTVESIVLLTDDESSKPKIDRNTPRRGATSTPNIKNKRTGSDTRSRGRRAGKSRLEKSPATPASKRARTTSPVPSSSSSLDDFFIENKTRPKRKQAQSETCSRSMPDLEDFGIEKRTEETQTTSGQSDDETTSTRRQTNELIVDERDVEVYRNFLVKTVPAFDVDRFDNDEAYKKTIFFLINPLVCIERNGRIERMLRPPSPGAGPSKDYFAAQLGLRSVSEVSSQARQSSRLKMSSRSVEYGDTSDSNRENEVGSERRGRSRPAPEERSALRESNRRKRDRKNVQRAFKKSKERNRNRKNVEKRSAESSDRNNVGSRASNEGQREEGEGEDDARALVEKAKQVGAELDRVRALKEYSSAEDQAIVAWVSTGGRARLVKGNRLWRELEEQYPRITSKVRSWQSLRNRYLRNILPSLGQMHLQPGDVARLRAAAATGEIKQKRDPRRNSMFKEPEVGAASRRPRPAARTPDGRGEEKDGEEESSTEEPPPKRARPSNRSPAKKKKKKKGPLPRYSEVVRQFHARHRSPSASSSPASPPSPPAPPARGKGGKTRRLLFNPN